MSYFVSRGGLPPRRGGRREEQAIEEDQSQQARAQQQAEHERGDDHDPYGTEQESREPTGGWHWNS